MGYSVYHELKKEIPQETWAKIIKDCKKLYKKMPEYSNFSDEYKNMPLLLNGCSCYRKPQFTMKHIYFNGGSCSLENRKKAPLGYWIDDPDKGLSHETFEICPKFQKHYDGKLSGYSFCKTARKPYDLMVKAVLLVCEHYLKDDIEISCDGDGEDWVEAAKFILNVLGWVPESVVVALL